ncbi:MAG TPA: hypothetical protein VHT91_43250 [Kofleriaceae bacterium]|jgi:hypothetical protein|nr:hypothetical protein [Kofleriaceae bacterium]
MPSTTNLAMTLVLLVSACGTDAAEPPPTYSELYTRYFALGTPGHCAMAGCHGDPKHLIWLCGTDKDTCYAGMTSADAGLINLAMPRLSLMADPVNSPLSWINPNGAMPFDHPGPFPEGRDAILAWIFAGAPND